MDGFSDLNLFALVAGHRNLAAAARELGVIPPAVSKRRHLGVRLTNRTTRRLTLTPEGELYLANGSRILDELSELEQLVTRSRGEPAGLLRVNASFGFGRAHIPPAVSDFVERFPAMKIQLQLRSGRSVFRKKASMWVSASGRCPMPASMHVCC